MVRSMKKGNLALGTVLGLILTIIIFVPAITFAAKLISGGAGSQNNLDEFITDLTEMKDALPLARRPTEAILDKESAFIYFESGQKYVGLTIKNLKPTNTASVGYFPPPLIVFERH